MYRRLWSMSDSVLASRILGSWIMPAKPGFSPRITFYEDGTFKVVLSSKKKLSKILDLLEGDRYEGAWHISNSILTLNYTRLPKSPLNVKLGIVKLPLANMVTAAVNLFRDRKYRIDGIDKNQIDLHSQSWKRVSKTVP